MELCLQNAQTVFKWLMMLLCGLAQTLAYLGSISGVYEISLAAENKHQVSFYIAVPLNQFICEPQSLPYKAEKAVQALGSPPTHLAAPVVHCECIQSQPCSEAVQDPQLPWEPWIRGRSLSI